MASPKTVLFVSHDRELLNRVATRIATLEPGAAGATLWVHPGRFTTYAPGPDRPQRPARGAAQALGRGARQAQGTRRDVPAKAAYNADMASPLQAAVTRLQRFLDAGPPEARAARAERRMRLDGGRTGKRAVSASSSSSPG